MEDMIKAMSKSSKVSQRKYAELMQAFSGFANEVHKEGALSLKMKELIAIGIAVVKNCELCMDAHVKEALQAGATREEVMEACYVATLMDGGPSLAHTSYIAKILEG